MPEYGRAKVDEQCQQSARDRLLGVSVNRMWLAFPGEVSEVEVIIEYANTREN